ncbi:phage tail protein [Xanthomonas theicola]|uniref:Phage tail protein n=1 Tax=Xanthomonas theicola TaxID=56464 RepID=A0A2S6ZK61_9XANT|nr:tail fiber protein [Xanthomonas theicola]PPT92638.1 phage tail protein [Xanthomonas theicola]QNH26169.1 phage tail protein [Xanthomonas theicola]
MSNSFIGEVRAFTYNFAPEGWLDCMGQLVSLQQYQALYAVIGMRYGGDGRTTFGLPDLRGRAGIGQGQGAGLSNYVIGQLQGADAVALTSAAQLPVHNHLVASKFMAPATAPGAFSSAPSGNAYVSRLLNLSTTPPTTFLAYVPEASAPALGAMAPTALSAFPPTPAAVQAHENRQPYVTLRFCICATDGVYPPRP